MFNISKNLPYYFFLPALLVLVSVATIFVWGLKPGIDLAGGSLLEVTYPAGRPPVEMVQNAVKDLALGEVRVQAAGDTGYILRQRNLTANEKNTLEQPLRNLGEMEEVQFTTVSPTIGAEILHKGLLALGLIGICMVLFIAFAFRGVSKQVASWKYGIVAIVTLLFDVLVPVAVFAALGHFKGAEVDSLFIVALLTILGISINDKIVVFDRIRENLHNANSRDEFSDVVSHSIRQTLARSINTSLTVVIMLLALYFYGPETTKVFALTLTVGMIVGTYSSIFFASPLLVAWEKFSRRNA
ncbi:MAG: protein translocase subunit SecF [Candidatus Adlerbacteria bacterium]|nr:protein translocase subunit SecF [Candidatus Adlerbacteria bacterium]